jgi:hypothetical protein
MWTRPLSSPIAHGRHDLLYLQPAILVAVVALYLAKVQHDGTTGFCRSATFATQLTILVEAVVVTLARAGDDQRRVHGHGARRRLARGHSQGGRGWGGSCGAWALGNRVGLLMCRVGVGPRDGCCAETRVGKRRWLMFGGVDVVVPGGGVSGVGGGNNRDAVRVAKRPGRGGARRSRAWLRCLISGAGAAHCDRER